MQHQCVRFGMLSIVHGAAFRAFNDVNAIKRDRRALAMRLAAVRVGLKVPHFALDGCHRPRKRRRSLFRFSQPLRNLASLPLAMLR